MFSVFVLLVVDFPEWSCLGLLVVLVSSLHYLKVGNLDGYSLGMWVWSVLFHFGWSGNASISH